MDKKKLLYLIISATVAVALVAYAVILLVGMYPEVLITAQDRNVYTSDSMFFCERVTRPFGLLHYVGAYLTQFFYHPALGAGLLIGIWATSVFAGIKAFKLKGMWRSLMIVPVACLLASVLDLGYWVYCLPLPGYWFSQSVAFLVLMLMLWAAHSTPRRFRIGWYVLAFALFPFIGWMTYMFGICFAISQFAIDDKKKTTATWIDGVGITLTFVAPLIFRALLYQNILSDDVFIAGFPFFKNSADESTRPVIPFYILAGATVILSFGRILPKVKKVPACVAYLFIGIASSVVVWYSIFNDKNYLYEMQMTQATMKDDWKSVISVAEKTKTPSRTMVMLKNIALLNTGELGNRSFELSNDGIEIYNLDSLNLNIMHIASPVIYYNHGEVNYATRWCMEFAVPYGFSPYYLKTLARCAELSGEKQLANRYTSRLHSMSFYSDWKPETSAIVKEIYTTMRDSLDSDGNSCERYIIDRFTRRHNNMSPHCTELSLLYSLILRSSSNFWQAFYDYLRFHKDGNIPVAYQEAFCLFMDKTPIEFPLKVNISPNIIQNYKRFWDVGNGYAQYGMTEDGVRESMRDEWSATYWWFNAFGRGAY